MEKNQTKIFMGNYHDPLRKTIISFIQFPEKKEKVAVILFPIRNSNGNNWTIEVSTQVGCAVGCMFCNLPKFSENLGVKHLKQQVSLVLAVAKKFPDHFNFSNNEKFKLSFTDGGEVLLNSNFSEIVEYAVLGDLFSYLKFSSTLPNAQIVHKNFDRMIEFTEYNPDKRFHMQVSLLASNDEMRKKIAKANLMPVKVVSHYADKFKQETGRKITLTFTMMQGYSLVNPEEIRNQFSPDSVMIRLYALKSHAKNSLIGLQNLDESIALSLSDELNSLGFASFYASSPQEIIVGYDDESNEEKFLQYGKRIIF